MYISQVTCEGFINGVNCLEYGNFSMIAHSCTPKVDLWRAVRNSLKPPWQSLSDHTSWPCLHLPAPFPPYSPLFGHVQLLSISGHTHQGSVLAPLQYYFLSGTYQIFPQWVLSHCSSLSADVIILVSPFLSTHEIPLLLSISIPFLLPLLFYSSNC